MTLLYIICGYLLGSVPFGLVLTRLAGYGDIRQMGSGNIGATNVLRTGNKPLALLTLICDSGKGAAAVLLTLWLADYNMALLAGGAALVGHMFPVWLGFKGGKGVATTLGTLLAAAPVVGAVTCGIWLIMAVSFRYSSLAALIATLSAPFAALIFSHNPYLTGLCTVFAILVWLRHRTNIGRLLRGEEPKIGKKKVTT